MELQQLPKVVQILLGAISAILLVLAYIPYVKAIRRKIDPITPRPLAWIGWALLVGIGLVSQVIEKGFSLNQIAVFMSFVGCAVVSMLSFRNGNIKQMDWVCFLLGIICIVVYVKTRDPWQTTVFAIIADTIAGLPTLHNAWSDPSSEKSSAWTFGTIAYAIAVIASIGHSMLYALLPIYLFCFNSTIILLTSRRIVQKADT